MSLLRRLLQPEIMMKGSLTSRNKLLDYINKTDHTNNKKKEQEKSRITTRRQARTATRSWPTRKRQNKETEAVKHSQH